MIIVIISLILYFVSFGIHLKYTLKYIFNLRDIKFSYILKSILISKYKVINIINT